MGDNYHVICDKEFFWLNYYYLRKRNPRNVASFTCARIVHIICYENYPFISMSKTFCLFVIIHFIVATFVLSVKSLDTRARTAYMSIVMFFNVLRSLLN